MSFFIADAYANTAPAAGPGATGQIVMLLGFLLIFYFLLWRPQAKRQKEARALIDGLQKGDEVVFAGGRDAVVPVLSGGVGRDVQVRLEGDALRLSGRWLYASGVDVADWLCVMVAVPRDGGPPGLWAGPRLTGRPQSAQTSVISKSSLPTPQSGHVHVSGTSPQRVPGEIPSSGHPAASS